MRAPQPKKNVQLADNKSEKEKKRKKSIHIGNSKLCSLVFVSFPLLAFESKSDWFLFSSANMFGFIFFLRSARSLCVCVLVALN